MDMFRRLAKSGGPGTLERNPKRDESLDDENWLEDLRAFSDRDFGSDEEEEGPDRRRDPLRH